MVVLLPLFLAILQLALVLHVRNTLTAAASDGARYAAVVDREPADGAAFARRQATGALADRFARDVTAEMTTVGGAPAVRVRVRAEVPAIGLWGPALALEVDGHAIQERP